MILHQATGIRRRPVIAVQIVRQHSQHGHLLAAMMRGVRDAPRQDPGPRSRDIEKPRLALEPSFVFRAQRLQPLPTEFRIALDEFEPRLLLRQRRRACLDSQHGAKPQILAYTLMHHLFVHAPAPRIFRVRPKLQLLVAKLAPHAHYFQPLGLIRLHKKVVSHRRPPKEKSPRILPPSPPQVNQRYCSVNAK